MSNTLSPQLIAQLLAQESNDPFLTLITLSHPDWAEDVRLVNNSVDITSRGNVFMAFPVKIRLSADDGETAKTFSLELDNVSLELVDKIRTVTTAIGVKLEMILASLPDDIQISYSELEIATITYNKSKIQASIVLDNFLNTELTSERYGPINYPGLF